MSGENTYEERFAAIYPSVYSTLNSQENFTEEEWKIGLATEANLQEETLTPLQKAFFTALRAKTVDTMKALIEHETVRDNFKLFDLLSSIDYWQMTNPLHPAQPHFSDEIRDLIWNLITSHHLQNDHDALLRWAIVCYQSDDAISALIDRIDNLDSVDSEGLTFLHLACFFNQKITVELLLAKNADPLKEDKNNNLPLLLACANNHVGIVMRLLKAMTDRSCIADILKNATTYSYSAQVKEVLQLYAEISARTSKMKTPLLGGQLLEKNGLHAKKPRVTLLPDVTAEWNQRVAEAEAEQKRRKIELK